LKKMLRVTSLKSLNYLNYLKVVSKKIIPENFR
jgi:hypothetical protein